MPTARPALVGRQVKRVIDSQWVEVETDKGEQYYANMINGDSRWDMRGDDEKLGGDEENVGRSTKGTGIGISVGQDLAGTALVVEAVVKGSASFRSQRVHVGDELLAIDGVSLARSSPAQEPPRPNPPAHSPPLPAVSHRGVLRVSPPSQRGECSGNKLSSPV